MLKPSSIFNMYKLYCSVLNTYKVYAKTIYNCKMSTVIYYYIKCIQIPLDLKTSLVNDKTTYPTFLFEILINKFPHGIERICF